MNPNRRARSAYAAAPIRTARGAEYAVFAAVTGRLTALDERDRSAFGRLAEAVADNQRLWATLAEDLMVADNRLPVALRAQLDLARRVRPPPQPRRPRRPRLESRRSSTSTPRS